MDSKGYYRLLGVDENASNNDIKKAFRDLSKKWHPDRFVNKSEAEQKEAEEKFKEINEAYSVLSDEQKRAEYTNGMEDLGFDPFSGFNPFDMFRHHSRPQQPRGNDVHVTITITMEEAYNGGTKDVTYDKEVPCHHCNGTGSSDGKSHTCPHCNGTGRHVEISQQGPVTMQNITMCPHCSGTGKTPSTPCNKCGGKGLEKIKVTENISFAGGIFEGAQMIANGLGGLPINNGIPGNLVITFKIKNDPYFNRPDAINVIHYDEVDFTEALLGFEKEYRCVDGTTVKLKIPECTHDGATFIRKGKGFPDIQRGGVVKGDYAIIIKYKYPNKLSKNQKELLKNFNK